MSLQRLSPLDVVVLGHQGVVAGPSAAVGHRAFSLVNGTVFQVIEVDFEHSAGPRDGGSVFKVKLHLKPGGLIAYCH